MLAAEAPAAPTIDPAILAAARADRAPIAAPSSSTPSSSMPAAGVDHAAAAVMLVEFAAASFFPLWPSLAPIYPKETRDAIAAALGPVLKKYDIDLNALPPELVLAIVILPTVPAALAAIRHDRAARAAAPGAAPPPSNSQESPDGKKNESTEADGRPAAEGLAQRFPGLDRGSH